MRLPPPLARRLLAVLPLAAAVAAARPAAAGDDAAPAPGATRESMDRLEATVRRVAAEGAAKTVAVRVDDGDHGLGWGSGAVVSAEGLVLTCAHVSEAGEGGGKLTAVFSDGRESPLEVVATNSRNDLSLCRMEPALSGLP